MPQSYTEIPSSQSLQSSLALILNNDKTAMSCSAGTVFPTVSLQVGMLCLRTDQNKLYILRDLTPTWIMLLDFSSGIATTLQASTIMGWTPVQQGGGTGQLTNKVYIGWTAASKLALQVDSTNFGSSWPISISGDSATVGGKTVGNGSGNVPLSNGVTNANLNADMVDGYQAGNASGQVPVSNGTVNSNLNADMLDGFHASSFVRTISGAAPDASGNVTVDIGVKADRNGANTQVTLGGTTAAYTATLPGLTPVMGTRITVYNAVGQNAGAAGLSVNGSASAPIQVWSNGGLRTLVAGDFPAGVHELLYTGSVWILSTSAQILKAAGGALTKSGETVSLNGIHGGFDATFTAHQYSGWSTTQQGIRVAGDGYGRVTACYVVNCNCDCNC